MKKKYISPATAEIADYGNPLLELGTTIPVDTEGEGASQSGAESKASSEFFDDADDTSLNDSISYRRDALDYLPKAFTKIWDD